MLPPCPQKQAVSAAAATARLVPTVCAPSLACRAWAASEADKPTKRGPHLASRQRLSPSLERPVNRVAQDRAQQQAPVHSLPWQQGDDARGGTLPANTRRRSTNCMQCAASRAEGSRH